MIHGVLDIHGIRYELVIKYTIKAQMFKWALIPLKNCKIAENSILTKWLRIDIKNILSEFTSKMMRFTNS